MQPKIETLIYKKFNNKEVQKSYSLIKITIYLSSTVYRLKSSIGSEKLLNA
jgi:hypothetical protein